MNNALQKAIDALVIDDVHLRRGSASLAEGFEPRYDTALAELEVYFKHIVRRYEILQLNSSDEDELALFRVVVELGARWARPNIDAEQGLDAEAVVAQVEASMVADYRMSDDPGEEALGEFARRNASYHIWPYWREFLSLQGLRMNMPKLTLPVIQVASNQDE